MSPYFVAFVTMLATFLLLTLGAVLLGLVRKLRPGTRLLGNLGRPSASGGLAEFLLYAGVALTWYNVASCWLAQTIFYPIYVDMSAITREAFHAYSRAYLTRLHAIILPGGLMCLVWALALWFPRQGVGLGKVRTIVALCVAFVAITPLPAGAQDDMYDRGFSADLYGRLMWSHSMRTVMFSIMGILALLAVRDLVRASSRP